MTWLRSCGLWVISTNGRALPMIKDHADELVNIMPNKQANWDAPPLYQWVPHWKQAQSTVTSEDLEGKLRRASFTILQPVSMPEEAPGVTPVPLWAATRPGNLSWCSCCQPWCCATAVCHPGGWDLLKGNHVNLSVTTQSEAAGWSWQAWQSRHTVLKAGVTAFLEKHKVGCGFFWPFHFIVTT